MWSRTLGAEVGCSGNCRVLPRGTGDGLPIASSLTLVYSTRVHAISATQIWHMVCLVFRDGSVETI
ncbi:hypothetical protein EYF80_003461 [Liparis tanakae]|uniref:Uncharacterized protein n=1 Tax=Liparis tanakae TaxID=230148 RepID=A0A4Z2J842_9TELE|nr:hypothetical protein EYF80_003461 [Liparis tanakae]